MLEGPGDLRGVPAKFENPVELNLFNKMYKVHTLCILNTFIPFVKI